MRVQLIENKVLWNPPMAEPDWSSKVSRWYQLDGEAFALTESLFQNPVDFDHLVLASPMASNSTDRSFVQTGASRAQKFVHTIPNIRASMALQALERVSRFTCLQKGTQTIPSAIEEFYHLANEGERPALALVEALPIDEDPQKRQFYQIKIVTPAENGHWEITPPLSGAEEWKLEQQSET